MRKLSILAIAALFSLSVATGHSEANETALPLIDPGAVTVSGISSGAAMAQQLHVAYGERFAGAGLVAGVPYGCAEGDLGLALGRCTGKEGGPLPVEDYLASIAASAAGGAVAGAATVANDRAWVFHGARDAAISEPVTAAAAAVYGSLLAPGNLRYVNDVPAAHVFPTLEAGGACDQAAAPWLGACGFDAAGELLQFLYPGLQTPTEADRAAAAGSGLREASLPGAAAAGMRETMWLFVPEQCPPSGCRLHVALHGCLMATAQNGMAFVKDGGYLPWARANGIVVACPEVAPQAVNPMGCWDWWGYTGPDYATRSGAQVKLIADWVQRLAAR